MDNDRFTHLLKAALLFLFVAGTGLVASSQDVIILKTGEEIEAQIIEINDVEIKYREYRDSDGIIFTMSRGKIREIRYSSGRREQEQGPMNDPAYYVDDRINNIKINFLALGGSHTILTYERALNPTSSFEAQLKINGLGFNNEDEKSGVGISGAYKLKLGSVFKKRGNYRPRHMLAGGYFRPVLGFNTASFDSPSSYYENYSYVHFGLDLGAQWIIANIVSLELFGGWHYYGGSFEDRYGNDTLYNEWTDGNLFAVSNNSALAFGFNVGILFGKPKQDTKKRRR